MSSRAKRKQAARAAATRPPEPQRPQEPEVPAAARWMGALCYLNILILIPACSRWRHHDFVRFHLNQGAVLFIISAIVNILDEHGFFGISLFHLIDFGIFGLVLDLLNLILFIMMIIGIVSACRGTKVELPMIGQIRLVK